MPNKLDNKNLDKVVGGNAIDDALINYTEAIIVMIKTSCLSITNDDNYINMINCLESAKDYIKKQLYNSAIDQLSLFSTYEMFVMSRHQELNGSLLSVNQRIKDLMQLLNDNIRNK